jgi:hypothetical protein
MCGIVGILALRGRPLREKIGRRVRALLHRGPDGSGTFVQEEEGVALGHSRRATLECTYVPGMAGRRVSRKIQFRTLARRGVAPIRAEACFEWCLTKESRKSLLARKISVPSALSVVK